MKRLWLISLAANLALINAVHAQGASNETLKNRPPMANNQTQHNNQQTSNLEVANSAAQSSIAELTGHPHETDLRLEQAAYLINRDPEDSLLNQDQSGGESNRHRLSHQLEQLASKERLNGLKVLTSSYRAASHPPEPYPSASYTTLLAQQPNVSSFLDLSLAGAQPKQLGTNDFAAHEQLASGLNTGLIQNLTASLFPIKQLSNATLISLSELLNKTRHSPSLLMQATNGTSHQLASSRQSLADKDPNGPPIIVGTSQRLVGQPQAPLTQTADSLLDYLRPSAEQLRHLAGRYQSAVSQLPTLFGGQSSAQPKVGTDQRGNPFQGYSMSPSSLLNTIMQPFSPKDASSNALDMAFYESLFDESPQRPLSMGTLKSYLDLSPNVEHKQPSLGYQSSMGQSYQQMPPFRPSIASPPAANSSSNFKQEAEQQMTGQEQTLGSIKSTGGSMLSPEARQKNLSEGRLFGSFGSVSLPSSTDSRSEYSTSPSSAQGASSQLNGTRFVIKDHPSSFVRQLEPSERLMTSTQMPPTSSDYEHFDSRFINNAARQSANNQSSPAKTMDERPKQTAPSTSSQQQAASHNLGQAGALFDIYEREIDSQIKEAFYGAQKFRFGNQQARQPAVRPFTVPMSSAQSWYDKTQANEGSLVEEESAEKLGLWPNSATALSQLLSSMRAHGGKTLAGQLDSASSSPDPLVAALQELPNFVASDLQPLAYATSSPPISFPSSSSSGSQSMNLATIQQLASYSEPATLAAQLMHQNQAAELIGGQRFNRQTQNQPSSHQHQSSQQHHATQSSGSSILGKLLGAPLSHLYKSRNRKPSQQAHGGSQMQAPQASASVLSPSNFLFPLASKNLLSVLGVDGSPVTSPSSQFGQQRGRQQQAAAAAAAMANLMAAAEARNRLSQLQTSGLSPLQLALLQSQASNPLATYQSPEFFEGLAQSDLSLAPSGSRHREVAPAEPATGSGVRANSVPYLLRKLFSPASWARKQSTSSVGSQATSASSWHSVQAPASSPIVGLQMANRHLLSGSPTGGKQQDHLTVRQQLTGSEGSGQLPANMLLANNLLAQGRLLTAGSDSLPSFSVDGHQLHTGNHHKRPPTRMAIKIIKIPVAYYEPLSSTASQKSELGAQRQLADDPRGAAASTLAASLLAKMVAQLQHSSAATGGARQLKRPEPQPTTSRLVTLVDSQHRA